MTDPEPIQQVTFSDEDVRAIELETLNQITNDGSYSDFLAHRMLAMIATLAAALAEAEHWKTKWAALLVQYNAIRDTTQPKGEEQNALAATQEASRAS